VLRALAAPCARDGGKKTTPGRQALFTWRPSWLQARAGRWGSRLWILRSNYSHCGLLVCGSLWNIAAVKMFGRCLLNNTIEKNTAEKIRFSLIIRAYVGDRRSSSSMNEYTKVFFTTSLPPLDAWLKPHGLHMRMDIIFIHVLLQQPNQKPRQRMPSTSRVYVYIGGVLRLEP